MSRIYDISVPIRSGGLVYPGNPEIDISLQQAVAKGAGANVSICQLRIAYRHPRRRRQALSSTTARPSTRFRSSG